MLIVMELLMKKMLEFYITGLKRIGSVCFQR